ncbi:MAG: chemotaxis protein CheB [Metallibacterium sp.]
MASTPDSGPAIALLFEDLDMGVRLREALRDRGARIVLEARVSEFQPQALIEHAADVVVLNLDPNEEAALERVVEALDPVRQRLVLNDAEATRSLAGWDAARWARHLAAKILGTDIDPPRPAGAASVPAPEMLLAAPLGNDAVAAAVEAPTDPSAPTRPEPAMNAALGREIEALLDDASAPDAAPTMNDPLRTATGEGAVRDRLTPLHDDLDALLVSFSAAGMEHVQKPLDVQLPADFEPALRAHPDLDVASGIQASASPPPVETNVDAAPITPAAIDTPQFDALDFDLDALLADLPAPEALPAVSIAPVDDSANDAGSIEPALDESAPIERVPQHEALAQPVAIESHDELSTADLDALLAEVLPHAANAVGVVPVALPLADLPADEGAHDPLLSMLAEPEESTLSIELVDFDPETWTPPTDSARPNADPSLNTDATSVIDANATESPEIMAAAPVSVGDAAPDLELMLDEMFEEAVPDAPIAPAVDVSAPDWGLLDFDAALVSVAQPAPPMDAPTPAPNFAASDGIELLPIEDVAPAAANADMAARREPARGFRRVVAIGASIGGPDAVREFLSALTPGLPLLLVVAQHLDEAFFVGYAAQFERALQHPVRTAANGLNARVGDVLLVPPRARIALDPDGGVHLLPGGDERYTPSIDDTFTRIADTFGARALALVFSGMASDALQGMRRVVERGGAVWAQSRETCVVSAMVDAAAAAGLVTFSGTPQELAARLNADFSAG